MTKQTPETLRLRASTLSLRVQAMENGESTISTQSSATGSSGGSFFEGLPRPNTTTLFFSDMDGRPSGGNTVCEACARRLPARERVQVVCSPSDWQPDKKCKLCAVNAEKPEAYTKPFCDFLTENPTVFHAVVYFGKKLADLGFVELPPRDDWTGKIEAGGKYWMTRNGSSLVAFTVGKKYKPGNGVAMVAGHIDALTARVKPVSTKPTRAGYLQLGVAPYAGALNQTWWDRDLGIGGRVLVKDEDTGAISQKLVKLDWPSMSNFILSKMPDANHNSCPHPNLGSSLRCRYDRCAKQGDPISPHHRNR